MKFVTSARKRGLWAGAIGICLALVSEGAEAVTANDDGQVTKGGNTFIYPCYRLIDVGLQQNGYIKATFKFIRRNKCKYEVYFAETQPKGKIRGLNGITGSKAKASFSIVVEPNTQSIFIEMAGDSGYLAQRFFYLQKYIKAAKRQNSGWQTAWKRSEQNLQETARRDKTPPTITLLSPDVTPKRKVFRLDTYQTFVRGRVNDDAGVVTVLVNGAKAGVKADGTFAKKVKLALGTNSIKVQAEDTNSNVSERTFTIIREEFISDEIIADVDIPKKNQDE